MEYIVENEVLRAVVSGLGAELVSVVDKATGAELLWGADPAVWNRHAPILFPYCGRLRNGRYTHKDVAYHGGGHGFARDLEHRLAGQPKPDMLKLCLEANALTMEKYPFAFKLFSTYALEGHTLRHAIEVVNDGDEPMPFGFGYHPGFVCPFDAQHTVSDYFVEFPLPESPIVLECGADTGLLTGREYPYFEDGTEIPLTDTLFAQGSLCLKGLRSKTIALVERGTGRRITMGIEGFPYVLLWSTAGALQFICIEPWHTLPDTETATGVWDEKRPIIVLPAGERWHTALPMTFER